jgi:hypothetical protein
MDKYDNSRFNPENTEGGTNDQKFSCKDEQGQKLMNFL